MSAAPEDDADTRRRDYQDTIGSLCHIICECAPEDALCGVKNYSGIRCGAGGCGHLECIVCHDLADIPCPRCGAP